MNGIKILPYVSSQTELARRRVGYRNISGWSYFMTCPFDYEGEKVLGRPSAVVLTAA
jgi:hypothetical protein